MKKFKKPLTLNKLVISKLKDSASVIGGSGTCKSRLVGDPNCKISKEIC